jgi:hypothetical protein
MTARIEKAGSRIVPLCFLVLFLVSVAVATYVSA